MIESNLIKAPINQNVYSVYNDESIRRAFAQFNPTLGTIATTNWAAANRIYYIPFCLKAPFYTGKLVWLNGNVVSGGANVQMGVYSASGLLLCTTGSVAQATASAPQSAAPTVPMWLAAGRYYWGLTLSATTNCRIEMFVLTTNPTPHIRASGFLRESADPGSFGLVTQATFAAATSVCPIVAMIEDTTLSY